MSHRRVSALDEPIDALDEQVDAELERVDPMFRCPHLYQNALTGEHVDAAYGYLVHPSDDAATIRCFIPVIGGEAASTPTSTPTAPASAARPIA